MMNCSFILSKQTKHLSIYFNKNVGIRKLWSLWKSKERNYEIVVPGKVSLSLPVPHNIQIPEYALTGIVSEVTDEVEIKNQRQINLLRKSCQLAKKILNDIKEHVQVGVTTEYLDQIIHEMCIQNKAYPSPLNYKGFPKSVCTSVNNVVCHGIPDNRSLKNGDIISIDVSVFLNGYHGDCAATYGVGEVDAKGQELMSVAERCIIEAVKICHSGQNLFKIGEIINQIASSSGFSVVPAFCGHGIGTYFHGPPQIFHFSNSVGGIMKPGMTFTIEPVICEGEPDIEILDDDWTAVTVDNSRTAQFENTVLITETGIEILTS